MTTSHWRRYVAVGDSFTEGIGDPNPTSMGGNRGWADRVAEQLSVRNEQFRYANLAVRGKLIRQILAEQVEPAVALGPDLVTLSGGGNDVIRPRADADVISALLEQAVIRLRSTGATVVIFTGTDVGFAPVFRSLRGRVAVYNENIRAIAAKHGALVADMWALDAVQDARLWDADRLHLNALGHQTVARMVLETLGVDHDVPSAMPEPHVYKSWREERGEDAVWAKEHLAPWVKRRLTGKSSGDNIQPKRPTWEPIAPLAH